MLSKTNYLFVCSILLIILSGCMGYKIGVSSKTPTSYMYLDYKTVNDTTSMKKTFKASGIEVTPTQEKAFHDNIQPKGVKK